MGGQVLDYEAKSILNEGVIKGTVGGVIDIACGTGAVLLHLAENGIFADGTDLSEEMCNVASKKAKEKGFDLNIFPGNMTEFKSDKKYSCAIIARSGFMHLLTPQLQRDALMNIRENLIDGGMLTFNTFDPSPYFQTQQMNSKDTDYDVSARKLLPT